MERWEVCRLHEKRTVIQLLKGLPLGMAFALPILILLFSARYWFIRADMVAHSQLSPGVMLVAVLSITIFVAVLFKKHEWEMKEQQYEELKQREEKDKLI